MQENEQFEDAESYNSYFGKERLTFKDIILQHLKRISQLSSVEFRGGYFAKKLIPMPSGVTLTSEEYVPDTREIYRNAVDVLADMLAPYFDKTMRESEEKFQKEEKSQKDKNELLKIKRKLFRELCCFLFRKKYLELGTLED